MSIMNHPTVMPDQDTRTPDQERPRTAHLDSALIAETQMIDWCATDVAFVRRLSLSDGGR